MSSSSPQSRLLQVAGHIGGSGGGDGEGRLPPVPMVAGDSVGPWEFLFTIYL